jgi:hypothetical protein
VKNNRTGRLDRHLDPESVYGNIVRKYGLEMGVSAEVNGLCVHSLRSDDRGPIGKISCCE